MMCYTVAINFQGDLYAMKARRFALYTLILSLLLAALAPCTVAFAEESP